MTQNKIIGVTGITGSGTSTVAAILQELGGFVISADKLAHEVMQQGQAAYDKIVARFGRTILNTDGEINRKVLGGLVFGNAAAMAELEAIIHPEVIAKTKELLKQSYAFAVIDAPLLIESGMYKICGSVWLVTAPNETRIARITSRDGIDTKTAMRRINSRKGDEFLRSYADVIIENSTTLEDLRRKIKREIA